jgi:hypothetical protein
MLDDGGVLGASSTVASVVYRPDAFASPLPLHLHPPPDGLPHTAPVESFGNLHSRARFIYKCTRASLSPSISLPTSFPLYQPLFSPYASSILYLSIGVKLCELRISFQDLALSILIKSSN